MKTNIQIFNNPQFGDIRIVTNESGKPMFCLSDVCKSLDLTNVTEVRKRLNKKGFSSIETPTNGGIQNIGYINEANLYKCIFQSRKSYAERFQDWVFEEVLPSIRKHGAYITPSKIEEALLNPDILIQLATNLKQEQQKRIQAEEKIDAQKPKVLFADAVATSARSCLVGELAKIIKQNGIDIGQNRLFTWLRNNGYLCKQGEARNQPTQLAMDMSLFEIKQTTINKPDGSILVSSTTKVTGKGQIYFVQKFLIPHKA